MLRQLKYFQSVVRKNSFSASSIRKTCSGATILDGLAISGTTAQNDCDKRRETGCRLAWKISISAAVTTNCKKSAEGVVPEYGKSRAIQSVDLKCIFQTVCTAV